MTSTEAISQWAVIVKILIDIIRWVYTLWAWATRALAFILGTAWCMIVIEWWDKPTVVEKILAWASTWAGAIWVHEATQTITKSLKPTVLPNLIADERWQLN